MHADALEYLSFLKDTGMLHMMANGKGYKITAHGLTSISNYESEQNKNCLSLATFIVASITLSVTIINILVIIFFK